MEVQWTLHTEILIAFWGYGATIAAHWILTSELWHWRENRIPTQHVSRVGTLSMSWTYCGTTALPSIGCTFVFISDMFRSDHRKGILWGFTRSLEPQSGITLCN